MYMLGRVLVLLAGVVQAQVTVLPWTTNHEPPTYYDAGDPGKWAWANVATDSGLDGNGNGLHMSRDYWITPSLGNPGSGNPSWSTMDDFYAIVDLGQSCAVEKVVIR